METKQHTSEQATDHGLNQKGNQNMHRNERKWKHNNPKTMGYSITSAKGKVCSNTNLPKETGEKSNK